jgi:hypothetical protein
LSSRFRPTPGGRDLGVDNVGVSGIIQVSVPGIGQVGVAMIGQGGRIIAKVGLGERSLRISQGGRSLAFPPALRVLSLLSRRFALFGRFPVVARGSRWLSGSCRLWKRIV